MMIGQQAINEFDRKTNKDKNKTNTTNTASNTTSNVNINDILGDNNTVNDDNQGNDNQSNNSEKVYFPGTHYEVMGKINIPKTNVNLPILEKVTPDSLASSVASSTIAFALPSSSNSNDAGAMLTQRPQPIHKSLFTLTFAIFLNSFF